jgi:hypothetical protein
MRERNLAPSIFQPDPTPQLFQPKRFPHQIQIHRTSTQRKQQEHKAGSSEGAMAQRQGEEEHAMRATFLSHHKLTTTSYIQVERLCASGNALPLARSHNNCRQQHVVFKLMTEHIMPCTGHVTEHVAQRIQHACDNACCTSAGPKALGESVLALGCNYP